MPVWTAYQPSSSVERRPDENAEYDAGDEREIHAFFRAQGAERADISEHDQVADDHGDQRALKAHSEHPAQIPSWRR